MTEWEPVWDDASQAYYYWNRKTNETTWEDPKDPKFQSKRLKEKQVNAQESNVAGKDTASEATAEQQETEEKSKKETQEEHQATLEHAGHGQTGADPSYDYQQYYEYYQHYNNPDLSSTTETKQDNEKTANTSTEAGASTGKSEGDDSAYQEYMTKGYFNVRTGKFQRLDDPRHNAKEYFDFAARTERQCGEFFDYSGYQDQANKALKSQRPPQKLTKKELDYFKKRKHEKKMKALRAKYTE